jgi:hypothetical protein
LIPTGIKNSSVVPVLSPPNVCTGELKRVVLAVLTENRLRFFLWKKLANI